MRRRHRSRPARAPSPTDRQRAVRDDGGLETELVFHDGIDLPPSRRSPCSTTRTPGPDCVATTTDLDIARRHGAGFVIETPTWRANPDWASTRLLAGATRCGQPCRGGSGRGGPRGREGRGPHPVVSGCVGSRGDGYDPSGAMTADEAERYHAVQIGTFADTSADQVTAITMTNAEEAIGIVRAAGAAGIPAAISFTVETDGRLPTGQPLRAAIEQVDAETGGGAAYFMVNCAHPTHFAGALELDGAWRQRLVGLRANASSKSHAELDESTELDEGDPVDLATRHAGLRERLPAVTVLGGCCGTDARHVAAICAAWSAE